MGCQDETQFLSFVKDEKKFLLLDFTFSGIGTRNTACMSEDMNLSML